MLKMLNLINLVEFKYSKVSTLIDRINNGITSNITKVIIRRDLKALLTNLLNMNFALVINLILILQDII